MRLPRLFASAFVFLLAAVMFGASSAASAAELPLDLFLRDLKTFRSDFNQTVVDSRGTKIDSTKGSLSVVRPGKFRWEVTGDDKGEGGQVLVADGRNVWFYDRDLAQVTVKPADAALSATPAMLLSGADVRGAFKLSDAGQRDGLLWTHVEPLRSDADFRGALLGFKAQGLEKMIVEDKLGQTATINFTNAVRNGLIDEGVVHFTPPAGVDVIGKPSP